MGILHVGFGWVDGIRGNHEHRGFPVTHMFDAFPHLFFRRNHREPSSL